MNVIAHCVIFMQKAFCSYITGTLATHAVLKGVGVGDSSASPVAATITWLLKGTSLWAMYTASLKTSQHNILLVFLLYLDGLGMIGRILFAWMKG